MQLIWVPTSREPWVESCIQTYQEKLRRFIDFEVVGLKSKKLEREDQRLKVTYETATIIKHIQPTDYVMAFDEKGQAAKDSVAFSRQLVLALESGRRRTLLIIGGAYGLGQEILSRADQRVSLSPLTFSHQVATVVVLEQVYRGFSIWKNRPYHNV